MKTDSLVLSQSGSRLSTCYIGAAALSSGYARGVDSSKIWLDRVQCRGYEKRLIDCPAANLGTVGCGHGSDAGVRCPGASNCTDGDVRLQEGTANQGIVEICFHRIWGRVCTDLWGIADAQVVCRQLGFTADGKYNI